MLINLFIIFETYISPLFLLAQEEEKEFTPLQPLPNIRYDSTEAFLSDWVTLLVGVITLLAVIWIVIAGIQYMSSDAYVGKNQAKGRIRNALIGLLLAGASWIILYTINPNILNINLTFDDEYFKSITIDAWAAVVTITEIGTDPSTGELRTRVETIIVYGLTEEDCEEEVRRSGGVSSGCAPSEYAIPDDYVSYEDRDRQQEEALASMREWEERYDTTVFEYIENGDWNTTAITREEWSNREAGDKVTSLESGYYLVINPPEREEPLVIAGEVIPEFLDIEGVFTSPEDCQKHLEYTSVLPNRPEREKNATLTCQTLP